MPQEAADSTSALKINFPLLWGPAELSKGSGDTRGSSAPGHLAAWAANCERWTGDADQITKKKEGREGAGAGEEGLHFQPLRLSEENSGWRKEQQGIYPTAEEHGVS